MSAPDRPTEVVTESTIPEGNVVAKATAGTAAGLVTVYTGGAIADYMKQPRGERSIKKALMWPFNLYRSLSAPENNLPSGEEHEMLPTEEPTPPERSQDAPAESSLL